MIREEHKPEIIGIVFDVADANSNCKRLMAKFETEYDFKKSLLPRKISEYPRTHEAIMGHRWYRYFRTDMANGFDAEKAKAIF